MEHEWLGIVAVGVGIVSLALLAVIIYAIRGERRQSTGKHAKDRPPRDAFRPEDEAPPPKKRAAVIVNPTKVESMAALTAQLVALMDAQGWEPPLVLETTADDPGLGQTRAARAEGVDLVCAMGGDGTVRAVAQELSGGTIPMGLLPAGTGNLLARNLLLPADNLEAAVAVATGGRNRHIDVGWITLDPRDDAQEAAAEVVADVDAPSAHAPTDQARDAAGGEGREPVHADSLGNAAAKSRSGPERRAFLVMAGMGFDAHVMEDTTEAAKARVGWAAYFAQGAKHVFRPRFSTTLVIDDGAPVTLKARTVLAGNCGRLTGGIRLMPDAVVDDGELNIVAITAKGIYGMAGAATHILARKPESHAQLDRWTARRVEVTVEEPQKVEIDGDVIGSASRTLIEVAPRSLIVRVSTAVPATPAPSD